MKRTLALLLGGALLFLLCACAQTQEQTQEQTQPQQEQPQEPVRFAVLSGPTGVGAAALMEENENGETAGQYEVTVAASNDEVLAGLTGPEPEFDIAAMATNVAANLYGKTSGAVRMLTVNGLGVLYILEREGESVNSIKDLRGRTLYAMGEGANPEYVLAYLLEKNGLDPETDLEIVWKTPEEITAMMISGQAELCMLPVPAATALCVRAASGENPVTVRTALDLNEQWDAVTPDSSLVMSCTVVRTEWAEQNGQAVADFLADYERSIRTVSENPRQAAPAVARFGLAPSEAIAEKAIPDCSLTFISGAQAMKEAVQGYFEVLFDADPASIGGQLPDDAFYYEP